MIVVAKNLSIVECCLDHGYCMYYNGDWEVYSLSPARLRSQGCVFCEEIFNLHNDLTNMVRQFREIQYEWD